MEENNKLIAEFMGWGKNNDYLFPPNDESMHTIDAWKAEDIPYHKSWDWLMPVIHKIKENDLDFDVLEIGLPIDDVYQSVVEFIKNHKIL